MSSLANVLYKIEQLYSEWQSLQPISKENNDRLWKKLRLEWNYNSNHIEGNTLTYGETQLLLLFDKTTGDHEMREFEEMKAHDVAIKAIQEWSADKERELTESDIRDLNRIILVRPYWKEALTYDGQPTRREIKVGEYKEHPNSVRLSNGEMFHYAKPEEVAAKMNDLMDWYRNNQTLPPVVLAAEMHYRFILIHPFDDGNGRIARLLVNYILMRNDLPPIVIKSADKSNYLTALNKADTGNREAFHQYIAEQLVWSLGIAGKAARGESVEEDDDISKRIELLKRGQNKSEPNKIESEDAILFALQHNYIPLLKAVDMELLGFSKLFEKSGWKVIKHGNIVPSTEDVNIDEIYSKLTSIESYDTQLQHKFRLLYIFKNYIDDDNFDVEVAFKIYFEKYTYHIESFVGRKTGSMEMNKLLLTLSELNQQYSINKLYKNNTFSETRLINYSEILSFSEIYNITKNISTRLINYIESKANKMNEN